jgi:hypothetical protein
MPGRELRWLAENRSRRYSLLLSSGRTRPASAASSVSKVKAPRLQQRSAARRREVARESWRWAVYHRPGWNWKDSPGRRDRAMPIGARTPSSLSSNRGILRGDPRVVRSQHWRARCRGSITDHTVLSARRSRRGKSKRPRAALYPGAARSARQRIPPDRLHVKLDSRRNQSAHGRSDRKPTRRVQLNRAARARSPCPQKRTAGAKSRATFAGR